MGLLKVVILFCHVLPKSFLLLNGFIFPVLCADEDRYSPGIPTYSVTVPRKVSEEGGFVSHYLPHFFYRRKKRSESHEVLSYIIPVENKEYLVHLWPSAGFIAPGLITERHSLLEGNRSKISFQQTPDSHCHFKGIVRGVENSKVALSTCYGLTGFVSMPHDEFLIEPSLDENRLGEYHKHFIYKKEDIQARHNVTNCGTKGELLEALKDRLYWDTKYGSEVRNSAPDLLEGTMYANISGRYRRFDSDALQNTEGPKCAMRTPHFLEIMVTIDAKIQNSVFYDLETFILTIFNMVAANFNDGSIGQIINIKLVRVIYLTYTLPRLDIARYSPKKLLENFCDWQLELNPLLESHPNHHDLAIFITRFEPCQGDILGLSNIASICRLDKSCIVVSENGLLLANIITHQIGHSLGADHDDGDVGGCVGEDIDGTRYHMSPVMSSSSMAWSICSQQSIGTFIMSQMGWCLINCPREHEFSNSNILPGQVYDAVQQCTLNFKMRSIACGTLDFCKVLYCKISPTKCATTGDPPAAGTPCAQDMWCFRGNCVHRGQRPGAQDGGWSPWSDWTPCTRTCGGGVQTRYRVCNTPPPCNGGRYCRGSWITHKMCATKSCEAFLPSFLDLQCRMTNKRPYKGRYYLWEHFKTFFEGIKCTLVCINEINQVSIRSPVVIDGTPCKPGTNNVCIDGECRYVGCDWVIDSKSKYDMCGLCHGCGTTCKIIQGTYSNPQLEGMEKILLLPEGTSMIFIREMDNSPCYLIITNESNKTYHLNEPMLNNNDPGEFIVAGSLGVYDINVDTERIFIRKPIKSPIGVSVKCSSTGTMSTIHYQYALPEDNPNYVPCYKWEFLYWDECSKLCGGGVQRSRASCVEAKGGEVEDRYCYEPSKPSDQVRACNSHPCTAKWWVGPWSDCDCFDNEGIMTRLVFCMKPQLEDNSLSKIVRDKECASQPKPRTHKPCSIEKDALLFSGRRRRQVPYAIDYEENKFDTQSSYSDDYVNDDYFYDEIPTKSYAPYEDTTEGVRFMARKHFKKIRSEPKSQRKSVLSTTIRPFQRYEIKNKHYQSLKDDYSAESQETDLGSAYKILIESTTVHKKKICVEYVRSNVPKELTTINYPFSTSIDSQKEPSSLCNISNFFTSVKTNILVDLLFPSQKPSLCPTNKNILEPADFGPIIETSNSSGYQLMVIPVVAIPHYIAKTDIGLATFGDSVYFPRLRASNQTFISGDNIFKILEEARRRATKPPIIDSD